MVTNVSHDFKGNLVQSNRKLHKTYASTPSWSSIASATDDAVIESTAASDLESETFTTTTTYDALNRVKSVTTYDALNRAKSVTTPDASIYLPTYCTTRRACSRRICARAILRESLRISGQKRVGKLLPLSRPTRF